MPGLFLNLATPLDGDKGDPAQNLIQTQSISPQARSFLAPGDLVPIRGVRDDHP
jgi:hypothetical protein